VEAAQALPQMQMLVMVVLAAAEVLAYPILCLTVMVQLAKAIMEVQGLLGALEIITEPAAVELLLVVQMEHHGWVVLVELVQLLQ
jgi:hypothetical protein